jgi:RES domain-containing protein
LSFEAVVYRATGYERPLWAFPNTSAGRWNRANSWPAQYLALHPMTPWAEVMRNLDLRTPEEARAMRVPIWAFRITLEEAPLAIAFEDAADHALDPGDLVADDRSGCQALAGGLQSTGTGSITVPSAALPGTRNLVVLRAAAIVDYHREPIDPEDQPAAMIAQDGRCPEGLWHNVHYQHSGTAHAGLQAYLDGDRYEFEQPEVTRASLAVT